MATFFSFVFLIGLTAAIMTYRLFRKTKDPKYKKPMLYSSGVAVLGLFIIATISPKEEVVEPVDEPKVIEEKVIEEPVVEEVAAAAAPVQEPQVETPPAPKEEPVAKPVEQKISIDKEIENALIDALGKTNSFGKPTVDSVAYMEHDKGAAIVLNASENLTTNMTKKGMWISSKDIFEKLKEIDGVSYYIIHWHYPLVDAYGNEEDGMIMAFDITKEQLDKINFDNFLHNNVPNVVNNYFEHAAFNN